MADTQEKQQEPRKKRQRSTNIWDTADSFKYVPLFGHAYRLYASSPDFKSPDQCWEREAVSILIAEDGTGRLLVSTGRKNPVKYATIPVQLKGDPASQKKLGLELIRFVDHCLIYGHERSPSSMKEARKIMNDFACEILDDDEGEWELKLYPSLGGHSFCFGDSSSSCAGPQRAEHTTLPSDLIMTTPNCDELGHYLFRQTEVAVSSGNIDTILADEVAAWDAILTVPSFEAGETVRIRGSLQSGSEEGRNLSEGLVGSVKKLDEDGDALIDFGADVGEHWVFSQYFLNFCKEKTS